MVLSPSHILSYYQKIHNRYECQQGSGTKQLTTAPHPGQGQMCAVPIMLLGDSENHWSRVFQFFFREQNYKEREFIIRLSVGNQIMWISNSLALAREGYEIDDFIYVDQEHLQMWWVFCFKQAPPGWILANDHSPHLLCGSFLLERRVCLHSVGYLMSLFQDPSN